MGAKTPHKTRNDYIKALLDLKEFYAVMSPAELGDKRDSSD